MNLEEAKKHRLWGLIKIEKQGEQVKVSVDDPLTLTFDPTLMIGAKKPIDVISDQIFKGHYTPIVDVLTHKMEAFFGTEHTPDQDELPNFTTAEHREPD